MTSLERRTRRYALLTKHLSFTLGRPATGDEVSGWIGTGDYYATLASFAENCGHPQEAARYHAKAARARQAQAGAQS